MRVGHFRSLPGITGSFAGVELGDGGLFWPRRTPPSADARQDRTLAPDAREPRLAGEILLEQQIKAFVEHYNHQRSHKSLDNVTPADAYFGKAPAISKRMERIKRQTLKYRRLLHRKLAA